MKATLRITGGKKVRHRLYSLDISVVRPTPHIVREALGSILRDRLPGARCLDLFAGTGAVGLEFLSRGASFCVFVEKLASACRAIEQNLQKLDFKGSGWVLHSDVMSAIKRLGVRKMEFDIVFADPPYAYELSSQMLRALRTSKLVHEDLVVIIERSKKERMDERYGQFVLTDVRRYGQTVLYFYELAREAGDEA